MQRSLDNGSIHEVGIGVLGNAFKHPLGKQPDWLFFRELDNMLVNLIYFGLLALSSSDNCKKRIEQAPIGYDSDSDHSNICLLHAGLPFGGLSHTQMH